MATMKLATTIKLHGKIRRHASHLEDLRQKDELGALEGTQGSEKNHGKFISGTLAAFSKNVLE